MFFEEKIKDQGSKISMELEIGRSSFYAEDSIYITVDSKTVIMDLETAKKFVDAVVSISFYHDLIEIGRAHV